MNLDTILALAAFGIFAAAWIAFVAWCMDGA